MRLYDRIMAGELRPPLGSLEDNSQATFNEWYDSIVDGMEAAVRVDVQNVADYIHMGTDREEWDLNEDYPNVAPPYESMWIEYTLPKTTISRDAGDRENTMGLRTALFVNAMPIPEGKGWAVGSAVYSSIRGYPYVIGPSSVCTFFVNSDGVVVNEPLYALTGNETEESIAEGANSQLVVPLMALSFMHCKNVTLEDAPFIGPRQQRRALERKGIKQAKFKTLIIEPMKQVLKNEGGVETNGLKKALHICRGHFATYSEDKPLFGKYSGTFWKPAHVRGNADNGTVYKDYKVKAPKD